MLHGAERSGDGRKVQVMEERSREDFTMLRCVIDHQCNAERSGAEMEERSREHFTMLRCVIHHRCYTERSGAEMEERSR